ncbi:MAG: isoprenylcysteine carboxyl methyltransferase [Candidatus Heimdallarchaeota archaeon]|nr:isoprenylcysteine carboxyl methyltransferase [Candidatus Heimdallarchaeota archaeon]
MSEELITSKMKLIILLRLLFVAPVLALLTILPSGEWLWIDGWLFILALTLMAIISVFWMIRRDPEMVVERMKGSYQAEQKSQDKLIVGLMTITFLAVYPLSGIDKRYDIMMLSLPYKILGWVLLLLSVYVLYRVLKENTYLSRSIVIQEERGQKVIDTGSYGWVRHPMYLGTMLMMFGTTLILGSLLGTLINFINLILIYMRAISEESLLKEELEGYSEYMTKVTKRLIPYIL